MGVLGAGARGLFVVCLPILLITTNLRYAINDIHLYEHGFEEYGVVRETGLEMGQLLEVAKGLISYFNSQKEELQIKVSVKGDKTELFNQREIVHLNDVKGLIQLCYRVQEAALAYILGYSVLGYLWRRGAYLPSLARSLLWGALLSVLLVGVLGLAAFLGFDRLFLTFHLMSFRNDFWLLDPAKDYLIRMFPEGFFFEATLLLAIATLAEALIIAVTTGIYLLIGVKGKERNAIPDY